MKVVEASTGNELDIPTLNILDLDETEFGTVKLSVRYRESEEDTEYKVTSLIVEGPYNKLIKRFLWDLTEQDLLGSRWDKEEGRPRFFLTDKGLQSLAKRLREDEVDAIRSFAAIANTKTDKVRGLVSAYLFMEKEVGLDPEEVLSRSEFLDGVRDIKSLRRSVSLIKAYVQELDKHYSLQGRGLTNDS